MPEGLSSAEPCFSVVKDATSAGFGPSDLGVPVTEYRWNEMRSGFRNNGVVDFQCKYGLDNSKMSYLAIMQHSRLLLEGQFSDMIVSSLREALRVKYDGGRLTD